MGVNSSQPYLLLISKFPSIAPSVYVHIPPCSDWFFVNEYVVITEVILYFTPNALFVFFPARLKRMPFSNFAIMENENIRENLQYFCKNMWWGGEVDCFVATHVNYFVLYNYILQAANIFVTFLSCENEMFVSTSFTAYLRQCTSSGTLQCRLLCFFSTFYVCKFHKVTYIVYPWSILFKYISLIL